MYRYFSFQEYAFMILSVVFAIMVVCDLFKKKPNKELLNEEQLKELKSSRYNFVLSILVLLITTVSTFIMGPAYVIGDSMEPNYHDKQWLLLNKFDREFEKNDIVVLHAENLGKNIIKRIVATEGDTVAMVSGSLYVNGELVDKSYDTIPTYEDFSEIVIPENGYFVMGDNRPVSLDSRNESVGCIEKKFIIGKIFKK